VWSSSYRSLTSEHLRSGRPRDGPSALELEQQRAFRALGRASILIGIAYSDDPEAVLDRLWSGAVDQLESEAAAAADTAGREAA
jgi:hypothetical protein